MQPRDIFRPKTPDVHIMPHGQQKSKSSKATLPILLWIALGATLAAIVGFTVQTHCQTYQNQIQEVISLMQQGKTATAADLANNYLASKNVCSEAEVSLASIAYDAGMQELYKHPELKGQDAVNQWQELEAKADLHKVPKASRSPMTVFTYSYNSGIWDLAKAAFIEAWRQGLIGPQDRVAISKYYSTNFNLAYTLLDKASPEEQRALQVMATAAAISRAYEMPQGEAKHYLETRFGKDQTSWPQSDENDLVLYKVTS